MDTNVLVHLVRAKAPGQWIDRTFGLSIRRDRPLCSVISLGEVLRIASRNKWGHAKQAALQELLRSFVVIQLGMGDIVDQYARLGTHLDSIASPMEQNDLWIAATAAATNSLLLTTDSGFDQLHPHHIERIYIDPQTLPRDP